MDIGSPPAPAAPSSNIDLLAGGLDVLVSVCNTDSIHLFCKIVLSHICHILYGSFALRQFIIQTDQSRDFNVTYRKCSSKDKLTNHIDLFTMIDSTVIKGSKV